MTFSLAPDPVSSLIDSLNCLQGAETSSSSSPPKTALLPSKRSTWGPSSTHSCATSSRCTTYPPTSVLLSAIWPPWMQWSNSKLSNAKFPLSAAVSIVRRRLRQLLPPLLANIHSFTHQLVSFPSGVLSGANGGSCRSLNASRTSCTCTGGQLCVFQRTK